jgi:hypothetical protein
MATKTPKQPKTPKTIKAKKVTEGDIVTIGSHSTRTQYANGKVDFVTDYEKLKLDVMAALEAYALTK